MTSRNWTLFTNVWLLLTPYKTLAKVSQDSWNMVKICIIDASDNFLRRFEMVLAVECYSYCSIRASKFVTQVLFVEIVA